ncbi:MAG: LysM peptidoglycan-binding domain-containing protein [Anaerolinea sp.]|mgnify:CR=1 FL=1|nr:LysM peptidoglycan-binding domain-containing protein [Anaerolinea sp.]
MRSTLPKHALAALALIALTLLACTLSNVPPTPTTAPFPTLDPALQFSTPLPGSGLIQSTATLDPFSGSAGATGALTGSNPNCPQPPGWLLYTVESGDTLSLLSVQTNTAVTDLATANCITDTDTLYVGQVIYVPTTPIVSP